MKLETDYPFHLTSNAALSSKFQFFSIIVPSHFQDSFVSFRIKKLLFFWKNHGVQTRRAVWFQRITIVSWSRDFMILNTPLGAPIKYFQNSSFHEPFPPSPPQKKTKNRQHNWVSSPKIWDYRVKGTQNQQHFHYKFQCNLTKDGFFTSLGLGTNNQSYLLIQQKQYIKLEIIQRNRKRSKMPLN